MVVLVPVCNAARRSVLAITQPTSVEYSFCSFPLPIRTHYLHSPPPTCHPPLSLPTCHSSINLTPHLPPIISHPHSTPPTHHLPPFTHHPHSCRMSSQWKHWTSLLQWSAAGIGHTARTMASGTYVATFTHRYWHCCGRLMHVLVLTAYVHVLHRKLFLITPLLFTRMRQLVWMLFLPRQCTVHYFEMPTWVYGL